MKRYFLGIDIGTFESRGILIDESFRMAADASVPHGMNNPQPGWFEQEAEAVWWGDLCKLCRTLIKQSGIRPEQIACVGTSALGTDCLPVDEQCRPLRPAILYGIDARASEEAAWLTEHYGQARVQDMYAGEIAASVGADGVELRFPVTFAVSVAETPRYPCLQSLEAEECGKKDENVPSLVLRAMKQGERLWDIAKLYRTTVEAILAANELKEESAAVIGKLLLIPRRR